MHLFFHRNSSRPIIHNFEVHTIQTLSVQSTQSRVLVWQTNKRASTQFAITFLQYKFNFFFSHESIFCVSKFSFTLFEYHVHFRYFDHSRPNVWNFKVTILEFTENLYAGWFWLNRNVSWCWMEIQHSRFKPIDNYMINPELLAKFDWTWSFTNSKNKENNLIQVECWSFIPLPSPQAWDLYTSCNRDRERNRSIFWN